MAVFFDQAKIIVKAGNGGNGMVAFRREKYVPDGGPAGGDGGKGGSVIFKVDEGLRTLLDFRFNRHFRAKNGENGMSKSMYGRGAEDLYVKVPAGTIIRNAQTKEFIADLVEPGQEFVVAKGGRGGRGNIRFATHKNPAPDVAENGEPGEEFELELELKVLADVGLVGFPSVGKSTILSVISSAKPKIGDYHFTTLTPQLGMTQAPNGEQFVVADLPGIIQGAHEGVGLGIHFLKHIERTKVILHVIDMAAMEGRDPYEDFQTIQNELGSYHLRLLERPMIIVANKMDQPQAEENLEKFKKDLQANLKDGEEMPEIFPISAYRKDGLQALLARTADLLEVTEFFPLEEEEVPETHVTYGVEEEEKPFTVSRASDGTWDLGGEKLEKLFVMTNFEHDESIMRFARQLRGMGIDEELRSRGAKSGDIVRIKRFEFEFVD
ncbi:GTP-binding protein [Granulicatella balaenopterae]|uniref:GTPase Obg n=1 Tax=Granulicatella balaenopterae TaxID=137733 RepID=A0A1H9GRF9_9LACT|nr:GTPase ObgE [Granulicatella balaenopterae]SEQ52686.1 GTP-binding protein [Granulicatella balaenopterae]